MIDVCRLQKQRVDDGGSGVVRIWPVYILVIEKDAERMYGMFKTSGTVYVHRPCSELSVPRIHIQGSLAHHPQVGIPRTGVGWVRAQRVRLEGSQDAGYDHTLALVLFQSGAFKAANGGACRGS